MLRIESLSIKNFMNITNASFEFGNINYFYGEPASGKSAVFEAISICFSDEKRSGTYGEYVKQGCDNANIVLKFKIYEDDAEIRLTLNRVNGTPYECELDYKGETYKNTKASEKLSALGISYYSKIMFQMQNAKDIVDQTSASRLEYIKNLFNFNYDSQKQIITEKLQQAKKQLEELRIDTASKNALKSELSHFEQAIAMPFTAEQVIEFNNRLSENLEKISKVSEAQKKQDELMSQLREVELSLHKNQLDVTPYENRLRDIDNMKNKLVDEDKRIEEYKEKIAELDAEAVKRSKDINKIENTIAETYKQLSEATDVQNNLRFELKSFEEREEKCKDGKCPICGQSTDNVVAHFEKEIAELKEKCLDADKMVDYYRTENTKAQSASAELTAAHTEYTHMKRNYENMIAGSEEIKKGISYSLAEEPLVKKRLADLKDSISKLEIEQKSLQDKVSSIDKVDVSDIVNENNKILADIKEYERANDKNQFIMRQNEEKRNKIKAIDEALGKNEAELTEVNIMASVYDEAWEVLNKLLPQYRTKVFCDTIKNDLNAFVHMIFPKYDVLVKTSKKGCDLLYTKDNTVVDENKNKWLDTRMSSGFERAVLTTAFKTILAKYYKIDFFVGDEIDKASSDNDSIKLFSVLLNLHQFHQLFLISHKKALGSYLEENYDDIYIFEAKNGNFTKKN